MAEKSYVRPLSQREADRCENAREPVCKCRCGGAKHGAGRVPSGDFSALPMDDPHYRPPLTKGEALKMVRHARDHYIQGESWIYESTIWRPVLNDLEQAVAILSGNRQRPAERKDWPDG
jgi:hypothetical protein